MQVDLAVVGQDTWLLGGYRAQAQAFWLAAHELDRQPHLFCIGHDHGVSLVRRSLRAAPLTGVRYGFVGTRYPALMPELSTFNHVANALRMASSLRVASSLWVVTTSAHHGLGAALAGRRYACWVGTGLADETAARAHLLPRAQRLSLELNLPAFSRFEREVLKRAALVYATSPTSQRAVSAAAGLPLDQVRILPIAIDTDRFRPSPDRTWLEHIDKPVIVFVGRGSDPRKNVGLLVDAFVDVRRSIPGAQLKLVGRLPDRSILARLPPGVQVLGEVGSVARVLREATLLVLPSLQEGFGVVVAEALACGLPVVVTPSGGPEDMVRASCAGRVLTGFTADELSESVVALLRDPDCLAEMRLRGPRYIAREHSPDRLVRLLGEAFERLDGC